MNNFEFYSPTRFVFGRDTEDQTGSLVREMGGTRVLLCYGGQHAEKSGLLDRVVRSLNREGLLVFQHGGILPNPTDENVYKGLRIGQENSVDFVVAVGGGSVIDAAKAIAAGLLYDGDFWDFYAGRLPIEKALPVGVVLTIPAAGSEGSGNSVITQVKSHKKVSLRTPFALRPKFAVMNPVLTFTLPPYQTAAGAVDMMAHIMERYFTPTPHTEVTDALSESLLRTIMEVLPRVLAEPSDYDARAALMWCGTLAHNGICGTGNEEDWASHGLEHELSAFYGVTHGAGLAVIFPAWLSVAAELRPEKPAQWARNVMGVQPIDNPVADTREGLRRYRRFLQSVGMPRTIDELGIEDFDLDLVSQHVHETKGEVFGAYLKIDRTLSRRVYEEALKPLDDSVEA